MPQDHTPGNIQHLPIGNESTSFTAASSPVIINVKNTFGSWGVDGYIVCDGTGDIIINFSLDGVVYGNNHTMKKDEILDLRYIKIHSIKITHSGTDSAYRVLVV